MKQGLRKIIGMIVLICMMCGMTFSMTACTKKADNDGKLSIVTTLFPQYDFAKQIAGNKANVTLLLSPGMEAHSYDPTPADIVEINESDLFIYTGENMETWAAKIIKSLEKDVKVLDVSEGIELTQTEDEHDEHNDEDAAEESVESESNAGESEHEESEHEEAEHEESESDGHTHSHIYDPHIWTSPVMAKQMVENILEGLIAIDPENEDYYRENAANYLTQLDELDAEIRNVVDGADIKTIYFADKFAMYYFVQEYGLDYVSAYDSCSSETEPSAKLVAQMVEEVKKSNAPAIFYAELSNHKAADTISQETGTEALLLHSCHNVSKDEFESGATYISLMKQNITNLKKGLYVSEN